MRVGGEALTEADLPWNCTVLEGRGTIHDIQSGPTPTLVGRLTLNGRGPGAWSAMLMDEEDPIVRDHTARLASDGSFTIEVPSEGQYRLILGEDREECALTTEIDLFGSRVEWSRDLPAGSFELSGRPVVDGASSSESPPEMMFAVALLGDLMVVVPIPPGSSSVHTVDPVPAGDYVVRAGQLQALGGLDKIMNFGRELLDFRVEQGEQSEVVLPE